MKKLLAVLILSLAVSFSSIAEGRIYVEDSCVSREHQDLIFDVCEAHGAEFGFPYLMIAMCEMESGGDECKVGCTGDIGLMQINPRYAGERMKRLGVSSLYSAEGNVEMGYSILEDCKEETWSECVMLMAYNEGVYSALRHANQGRVSEYARKILCRRDEILEDVFGKIAKLEKAEKRKKKRELREYLREYEFHDGKIAGAKEVEMKLVKALSERGVE